MMATRSVALALALILAVGGFVPAQPKGKQEKKNLLRQGEVPNGAIAVIDGVPVTEQEFNDELALRQTRPTGIGMSVVEALIDEYLIVRAMSKKGISVTDDDVQEQIDALKAALKTRGQNLEEELKKNGVPMDLFRKKIRRVAALDKLARPAARVPDGKPVTNLHRAAWLQDQRKNAKIVVPPNRLPKGVVATVDGHRITSKEFAADILVKLKDEEIAKVIEDILQEKLIVRVLATRKLKITEADLLQEWDYRKRKFNADPRYKGVPYDEIVKQQTGLDPATLRSSLGFRVNTALGIIARNWFTPVQLKEAYSKHTRRYGPQLSCAHILIEATDIEARQKSGMIPSFPVAKTRAEHVLAELEKGLKFDELARVWSKDKATKQKGGRLPTFTPERTVFEESIVKCAEELQVGEVSQPVRTRSGWHLIKLLRKDAAPPLEDKEVQNDLRRFLAAQVFTKAYSEAKIGIDFRRKR